LWIALIRWDLHLKVSREFDPDVYLSRNSPATDPVVASTLLSTSGEVLKGGQFAQRHPGWKRRLGHLELVFLVYLALFSSDFSVLSIRNT
jgi:hypothetical protein